MNQKISIIIPTYNRERWLLGAIKSVYNVHYRPLELVIVDDGSTDRTRELLDDWTKDCMAVGVTFQVLVQLNSGAAAARNHGLAKATGDFILFLDSDDSLNPEGIVKLVTEIQTNPQLDVVYGLVSVVDTTNETKRSQIGKPPMTTISLTISGILWVLSIENQSSTESMDGMLLYSSATIGSLVRRSAWLVRN